MITKHESFSDDGRRDAFDRAVAKFFDEQRCPELALEASGVPGMAVAAVYSDGTTVCRGYGVRKAGTELAVDENTVFQLASVSKPITSTIVAALVGKGVLGWDDLASRYEPNFNLRTPGPLQEQTVTVADLLAHCSGLPEHAGDLLEDLRYTRIEIFHQLKYLPVAPRKTQDWYTNFGFTAAAVAATRAAKKTSWEDLAAEVLYEPLGMKRTSSRYVECREGSNCAVNHQRFARYPGQWEWVPAAPRNPEAQSPAGGVSSCVADMSKWMLLQLRGGVFGGKQIVGAEALAKTHRRYLSPSTKHGLGWDVGETGELSHSGGFLQGTSTCVRLWPALGAGIVALTNGEPIGVPEAVCLAFRDYLLGNELPNGGTLMSWLARAAKAMSQYLPAPQDKGYETWVSDPPRELSAYCGRYQHTYYGLIQVTLDDSHQPGSSRRLKLILGLNLDPLGGGRVTEVYLHPWRGDTFVYQTFGENAVGLSAVEFDLTTTPGKPRVCIRNLHYSGANPNYSEIDPDSTESAWFTLGWHWPPGGGSSND